MKVFISGGCKNGKSTYAEKTAVRLSDKEGILYYAATMIPADREDEERIARHRRQREGLGFKTVEIKRDINRLADMCGVNDTVLLDSVTALLANEMFLPEGNIDEEAYKKICAGLSELFLRVKNIVIVSDYIYSDGLAYDRLTEKYRSGLAEIDKFCAKACDTVVEACCGNFIMYKGEGALDEVPGKAV